MALKPSAGGLSTGTSHSSTPSPSETDISLLVISVVSLYGSIVRKMCFEHISHRNTPINSEAPIYLYKPILHRRREKSQTAIETTDLPLLKQQHVFTV